MSLSFRAGLSRLSCVAGFRIATAFHPAEGAPLPMRRGRLLAGCSTRRRAASLRRFHSGQLYARSPRRTWFRDSARSGPVSPGCPANHAKRALRLVTRTCVVNPGTNRFLSRVASRRGRSTPRLARHAGSGIPPAAGPSFRAASQRSNFRRSGRMRPWSAARASIPASRTVLPGRVPCTLRVYDYAVSPCSVIPGQCAHCRGNPPVERKRVGEGGLEPPFWG